MSAGGNPELPNASLPQRPASSSGQMGFQPGQTIQPSAPHNQAARPAQNVQYVLPQPSSSLQQYPRPSVQTGLPQTSQPAVVLPTGSVPVPTGTATRPPSASTVRATDAAPRKYKKRKIEGSTAAPQRSIVSLPFKIKRQHGVSISPSGRPKRLGTSSASQVQKRTSSPGLRTRIAVQPLPKAEHMSASEALTQLQDVDAKILKCLAAQKLDASFALRPSDFVKKRLRLYIMSEHHNQHQPADSTGDPPSWSLRLFGKLVDPSDIYLKTNLAGQQQQPMTAYIKHLKLLLSGAVSDDSGPTEILWDKEQEPQAKNADEIVIKRRGSGEAQVSLEVELDSQPPMFHLSQQLSRLTGLKQSSRTEALAALWTYIKHHHLQDAKGDVRCDGNLKDLFEEDSVAFSALGQKVDKHMEKPSPYKIQYTVRPSRAAAGEMACYDMELRVAGKQQGSTAFDRIPHDAEADKLQLHVNSLVEAAKERERRRDFLLGFSASPSDFLLSIMSSQAREMRGAQGRVPEAMRRSHFFNGKWVEDAVLRYLHRRMAAGS